MSERRGDWLSPLLVGAVVAAVGCGLTRLPRSAASGAWPGVDEAVIGQFVARAGLPEPPPLFTWLQGDVLLLAFLCAGLGAGFVLGYCARLTFFEQRERERDVPAGERA